MAQRAAELKRSEQKEWKKDQQVRREVLGQLNEGGREGADSEPTYKDLNRDQARGDWDRTRRRGDEDEQGPPE